MQVIVEPIEKLVNEFSKLPGVGRKTAQRYAYSIIEGSVTRANELAKAITEAKENVHYCERCGNFTDQNICSRCAMPNSEPIICVVTQPKDVMALENVADFHGTYHVLHGVISPLNNVGPNDINLKSLIKRVQEENIKEVIVATNPDVEGEATAMYIASLLKPLNIKVSRIAQGIAMGSELEYADVLTLNKALDHRTEM